MHERAGAEWAIPTKWFVVFHKTTTRRWIRWLACGRYKHVSLFGYAEAAAAWVLYDVGLERTEIAVIPDRFFDGVMARHIADADVIEMEATKGARLRFGGHYCVPAVGHVLGLRVCALRPDALYRHCLANGGKLIGDHAHESPQSPEAVASGKEAGEIANGADRSPAFGG